MKRLLLFLPAILFLLVVLPAQSVSHVPSEPQPGGQQHGDPQHGDPKHGDPQPGDPQHTAHDALRSLADTPDQEFFVPNFIHLLPHPLFFGGHGDETAATFYNNNLYQLIAVVLILFVFSGVKASFGGGGTGFTRVFRGWCHWLRDEVVYSVMGPEDGRRWAPFFLYLFFFMAVMNLLGLVPVYGHTATASYYVTGTMACITFFCMLFFGMRKQGVVGYFVHLLPHGLPVLLIPLMAVVELVGMFIKPFALMVRLFANMLGGHMVTYAFLGMIFLFAKMMGGSAGLGLMTAVPAVAMGVFINIIEAFIALLQAYVFTYLSVIFIHQAMHPAH